ncbi:MAG: HNH endonuclease signature motif containing protein, partial [Pseudomonadota bacterium]
RERDSFTCQNPDCRKNDDGLVIHHVDYDKRNCNPKNLITLCRSCNGRANFNREFWEAGYAEIIRLKYEAEIQIAV